VSSHSRALWGVAGMLVISTISTRWDKRKTVQDGNGILGHIFGSKDVSREVAARASAQSGVGADVLKKLLPIGASS